MDVEASLARRIEHRLRQDQAVSRDHRDIEVERGEFGLRFFALQALRRADGQAMRFGPDMHRALLQFFAALRRARRLRIDARDFVPRGMKRGKRRHRKGRRSHEGDAHGLRLWRRMQACASIPLPLRERAARLGGFAT